MHMRTWQVVLAHWIKLARIASHSAALGPLFQCVGVMLFDIAKWLVLTTWPLIAFTSSFTVRQLQQIVTPAELARMCAPRQALYAPFPLLTSGPLQGTLRVQL
jgi:hypothetical protein